MPREVRALHKLAKRNSTDTGMKRSVPYRLERGSFLLKLIPALRCDQTFFISERGQSLIGVILTQPDAIFCPAGEHSIRFFRSEGDQVIDQNPYVGLTPLHDERFFFKLAECGIRPGNQSLSGRFFVTGRSIDLACKIEPGDKFSFEGVSQLGRRKVIVFDGVPGAQNLG